MNDHDRALLLSLRPRFADSILSGNKSVELRRQRITPEPGTPVILYASAPTMGIVGTARIADAQVAAPDDVWEQFHERLGLTYEEFALYLAGATQASALELTAINPLPDALPLAHLRATVAFSPPQSYRYLAQTTLQRLVTGHPAAGRLLDHLRAEAGS
jgi:predicted transcriptional regulator